MNDLSFAELIEERGWEYILTRFDPDTLDNGVLAEALHDAQIPFQALLSIAPSVDDFDSFEDIHGHKRVRDQRDGEYFERYEDGSNYDLVDLFENDDY